MWFKGESLGSDTGARTQGKRALPARNARKTQTENTEKSKKRTGARFPVELNTLSPKHASGDGRAMLTQAQYVSRAACTSKLPMFPQVPHRFRQARLPDARDVLSRK